MNSIIKIDDNHIENLNKKNEDESKKQFTKNGKIDSL